jgi:threonine dehydrogenase-like Zn-dependent dehydrogenase
MTKTPILERGVDAVFDCVGSPETIDLGLHLLRSTGTFVLIGAAGKQPMDWSLVWNRRIDVSGTYNFGPEPAVPAGHTMAQVVEWLADPKYRVDGLVTSVFDLDQWKTAVETASSGPRARSVKATIRPNPDIALVQ